ncbi:unnamed protein product [Fusarium fujikuroi]|nr:unnamed protein product [Fusarium fujikuroi]VZI07740.1 unnamed protein product [Fusarium fujikuroi]
MEQSKIVDFFSSSPSSQQPKERLKKRNKPSPAKAAKAGSQSGSPNSSRAESQQTMPKPSQKPKRQRSQASTLVPRAASLQPSIPSIPISKNMSSPQITKKRRLEGRNERVPETPPKKRAATSSQSQQTPQRTSQLVQANSPNTPFDISSGESSDSDCVIEKVQPSPKRKLVAPSPRARPTKKRKTDQQEAINRGYACIKASVLAKGTTLARQNKKPAARQRQAASVPPQAPLPNLTSSAAGPSRSTSVPPAHIPPKSSQNENATQVENESDHNSEKAQLSPKKRNQLEQQKANVKRRRVGDSVDTPVSIDVDDENQPDSDIEVVKVAVSPRRKAAKHRATADKNIKTENSAKQQKAVAQRKTQSPSVAKRPTPAKSAVARDTTPCKTLHIDLTQEPSDSSDFSDEETPTLAKPTLPTPVEHSLDVQNPQATATEHISSSNTDNPVAAPRETVPVHEQRSPSPGITGPLLDWLDRQSTKTAHSISSSNCPSPDHEVPFSTAPEYQHDDTAAKKINMEAQDSDMKSIKKESIEQYNSDDDEGSSNEESHDGDMHHIKQESSSMYGHSSDDEEDFDEEDIKRENHSSPMNISALKQYESHPKGDNEEEYEDGEEDFQGFPDLSDGEVSHDANTHEAEENGNVGSSPPVSYQLPQEDVSPKAVSTTLEKEATFDSADKYLTNALGISKNNLSTPIKTEKGLSPSIYELQPVYSGEKLMQSHTPGTPSPFRPHHRDSLLGLRSILKGSGGRGRASDNESVYSPFPDISPLSGDEYAASSPTERIQQSKEQAKAVSSFKKKLYSTPPQRVIVPKAMTLPRLLPKNGTPTLPQEARWLKQKKDFMPLPSIPDGTAASDAASRQETPTKIVAKRPPRVNGTTDIAESEDEIEKKLQEQQLEPGTDKHWIKPSEKEIKPPIIRDGVSEHAIKPTVALFKKKIAARQGFNHDTSNGSNQKYNWEIDWSTPASLTERESQAVAAELEHRGIKTSRQYSNFWYNLTMKFSRLAGSPIPLFTAKKKALDTFVDEAMQNQEIRRRNKNKAALKKARRRERKKTQPKGVDAFLIPGDTDAESDSEDSDSDLNGADLIAQMRADTEKRQRTYGGGTSCGRRSK